MYATVAEANTYAQTYYSSTDAIRVAWEALSDSDKQVQLNKAEQAINLLPYRGKPVTEGTVFPRKPNADESLAQVKVATMELALQLLNPEGRERFELRRQGVKSYKIGDLSETLGTSSALNGIDEYAYSIVIPFLRDWLGGGFKICPTRMKRFLGYDA